MSHSTAPVRGQTFRRDAPGYEAARQAAMWNARRPDRFPDIIVQANDVYEVVQAVRLAKREGLRVGVRSGGHSWAGNHVRDGGMLLDVSRLRDAEIDRHAMRARVGPGCAGHALASRLGRHGLFFPAGHCQGVALGGYLLQGGFGWHSRTLGPACMSVEAIDCVTADGDLVHASATENPELYWAARGAGPGFFAVVTRFHLRLYPRPRVIGFALQRFSADHLDDVFRWLHAIGPEVSPAVELQVLISRGLGGIRGPGLEVVAPVFADGLRAALRATAFMRDSPRGARRSLRFVPSGLGLMYRGVMNHYPDDHRYAVDNMWTRAPIDALLPGLHRIVETLPPAPSHALWLNWAPPAERPDMAFSMEDRLYLALYAVWRDAADDHRFDRWPVERMRELAHLATGIQLADENLGQRPAKFVADPNLVRLDAARAAHDPAGRFHPWMGRP
ncbi:MAG: FAD-binding oxidoreductase [Deltaproteobacteria bacterium]|nr:FAD-binding oxidoreductase [Deltaproteobacteria bacterium]